MKTIYKLLAVVITISSYGLAGCQQKSKPHDQGGVGVDTRVSPPAAGTYADVEAAQFATLLSDPQMVLLDVRTPEEVAAGKIREDALVIDYLDESHFEESIGQLDKNKTYLVYCRSGKRSAGACEAMAAKGMKAYNLKGGYLAWQNFKAKQ